MLKLERLWNGTVKTMIGLGVASLIGLTGMTANYFRTHEAVVKATCIEDRCEYQHPDPETTHLLNYLAGKEEVTVEENKRFYCDADYIHDNRPIKENLNQKLYDSLWQMEREFGSPQIRGINWKDSYSSFAAFSGIQEYNPYSHTIYLECKSPKRARGELMAEFAHASQFQHNQLEAQLQLMGSFVRMMVNAANHDEKLFPAYCREYSTWDSLEYEAHRIIEPQLRERLKSIVDREKK